MKQESAYCFSTFPYPGLRPFNRDEADIFFGREKQITQLLAKLGTSRFLAVVGPSGCGKSSLIKAGLIPYLEAGFIVGTGSLWRIAEMRPGDHPMLALAKALLNPDAMGSDGSSDGDAAPFLAAELRSGPLALAELLRKKPLPPETNLLILVDQFEEIFRMGGTLDPDESNKFVDLLLETLREANNAAGSDLPVYLILTMRSDFLGDCALFRGLPEAINENLYLTPRLTREQTEAAIVGPARVCGGEVDSVLTNRLLNEINPDPDQLPVLQHALMRMWHRMLEEVMDDGDEKRLLPSHYKEIGETLGSSLDSHAKEVFDKFLAPEQRPIAETMFRCLTVRAMGERDRRRPCRLEEIAEIAGTSWENVAAVADVFRKEDCNFVMPPPSEQLSPNTMLDIGHESLIRQWIQLNIWVSQEAQSAATYQRLVREALGWKAGESGPWQGLNLERIQTWWEDSRPSAPWARRYTLPPEGAKDDKALAEKANREFALAQEFIQKSQATQEMELERNRKEQARLATLEADQLNKQRVLKKISWVLLLVIALGGATASGWIQAISKGDELARQRDEAKNTAQKYDSERRRVGSLTLKNRASKLLEDHPDLAALLNLEKERLKPVDDASKAVFTQMPPNFKFTPWLKTVLQGSSSIGSSVTFSPDGKQLAASDGAAIRLWDLHRPGLPPKILEGHTDTVQSILFAPGGKFLVSTSNDGTVRIWDVPTLMPVGTPIELPGIVLGLALSHDGNYMATTHSDGTVKLWNFGTRQLIKDLTGNGDSVRSAVFSPDGRRLAAGYRDKARIWSIAEIKKPRLIRTITMPPKTGTDESMDVAFSPDGQRLATLSDALRIWDTEGNSKTPLSEFTNLDQDEQPWSVTFSPDGEVLAQTNMNGTIRLWNIAGLDMAWPQYSNVIKGHNGAVWQGAFSPDGRLYASVGDDGAVKLWDWNNYYPFLSTIDQPAAVPSKDQRLAVGYQGHGQLWIATRNLKTVTLYDGSTGNKLGQFSASEADSNEKPLSRIFSADGTHMAIGYRESYANRLSEDAVSSGHAPPIRVIDSQTTQNIHELPVDGVLRAFALNRDGTQLSAVYAKDRKDNTSIIRLWSDVRGKSFRQSQKIDGKIWAITFSPDGTTLATIGENGLGLLRTDNLESKGRLVTKLAFGFSRMSLNPGGTLLALARRDRISLWETQTGRWTDLKIPRSLRIADLVFSPNGADLITLYNDGSIARWKLSTESWQNNACTVANRNLTCDEWNKYVADLFSDEPYHVTCANQDYAAEKSCPSPESAGATFDADMIDGENSDQ